MALYVRYQPIALGGGGGSITTGDLTDAGTDGIVITNGTGAVVGSGTQIAQHVADASHNGYLSSTDWSTFNSKQSALTIGNLTDAGTDGITVTGGTGAVIGSGTSISQHVADASHNGYLSSTDWTTFNNKQAAGSYITSLTTDVVASGPGAAAATIQANVVTNAKLAQMATLTIKGNNTGGTANAADLTVAQVNAILPVFTSSLNGLAPSSGGGSTNFLRADGTWAVPAGTGVTAVSVASANGFAGSSSGGTTPSLTLSTSITGILKGNGTAISAATSGTDYSAGTSGLATGILKSTTTTGALTIAVAGDFPTLNQNTTGTAANITASSNTSLTTLSNLTSVGTLTSLTSSGTIQGNAFTMAGTGDFLTTGGSTSGLAFREILRSSKLSIALNASSTITIPAGFSSGLLIVADTGTARSAMFFLATSTIAIVSDPRSEFSITGGTGSKINVTCSGGVITIENKLVAGGITAQAYMVGVA